MFSTMFHRCQRWGTEMRQALEGGDELCFMTCGGLFRFYFGSGS